MRQRVPCHLALKAFPLHCSLPFFMRSYFLKVNGDVLAEQLWENKLELRKMYCTLLLGLVEGLPQPNRQGPEVGCFLTNLSTRCQKLFKTLRVLTAFLGLQTCRCRSSRWSTSRIRLAVRHPLQA